MSDGQAGLEEVPDAMRGRLRADAVDHLKCDGGKRSAKWEDRDIGLGCETLRLEPMALALRTYSMRHACAIVQELSRPESVVFQARWQSLRPRLYRR